MGRDGDAPRFSAQATEISPENAGIVKLSKLCELVGFPSDSEKARLEDPGKGRHGRGSGKDVPNAVTASALPAGS